MTFPYAPPDGVTALKVWLAGASLTAGGKKPVGVYPYFMLTELPGTDDKITHFGKYRVHAFDVAHDGVSAMLNARNASWAAHSRILGMGPPLWPQQHITLPGGLVVQCDQVKTKLSPHQEPYAEDATVERFIAEYDIDWRFIAM